MACRFPGGADTPDRYWELLRSGRSAIGEPPPDRWDPQVYDADPSVAGRLYVSRGGYLDDVAGFDCEFFGMSPREAVHVDPQHRLLLEMSYEAFEDAGVSLEQVAGSSTGVFVGISTHDYGDIQVYPSNRTLIDGHSNSGSATSLAANRISYMFDLRGPSMIVDTACSSSLSACHLAVASLRRGECELAVLGGIQLVVAPELTIGFCKAAMLSPDCRCAAFDAGANGYVRSEGGAAVVLKPLRAAIADGDRVYAVLAGTAVNQDGHTSGMTVPSAVAQEAVVRAALADAGIEPGRVAYVEAHGTGTPVGDPIEATALGAVFAPAKGPGGVCAIGSVKTNIGHLEAASGMAGLCKAALSLWHRQIPKSLHFSVPNPDIDFEALRLRVVDDLEPWPAGAEPVAGVNSFGFGGANGHAVLVGAEPAPPPVVPDAPASRGQDRTDLLVVSGRTREALVANARAMADHLVGPTTAPIDEVCRTAARRRSHHQHRAGVVASSPSDMAELLEALAAGERRSAAPEGRAVTGGPPLAFVFSGMGPQWWGMGRQLLTDEPAFGDTISRCDAALREVTSWSLLDELHADDGVSRVAEPDLVQLTNFAVQMGLVALWDRWGVRPAAVMGHSGGEMAAACAAGALTLEDAAVLCWHRGRLMSRAGGKGRMLAVGLAAADVGEFLVDGPDGVCLAAVNAPSTVTLSGHEGRLEELVAVLTERQVFARMLSVVVPYHSAHMDPIEEEILASLEYLRPEAPRVPMVSAVTADWVSGPALDAGYWWRSIRQPVLFADGLDRLIDGGYRTFVEIAPHPVLSQSVGQCLAARGITGATIVPSLRRMEDDRTTLLRSAASLWTLGTALDWAAIGGEGPDRAPLPAYRWTRERHWFESRPATDHDDGIAAGDHDHPLLGRRVRSANPLWELRPGADRLRWLDDHVIDGTVIHPGAAYVEAGLAVARLVDHDPPGLRDLDLRRALLTQTAAMVQTSVAGEALAFHASNGSETGWELHAAGHLDAAGRPPAALDLSALQARCPVQIDTGELYDGFHQRGLQYGPAFVGITEAWKGEDEAFGTVTLPDDLAAGAGDYLVHPALLDAAFQLLLVAAGGGDGRGDLFLPVHVDHVGAWGPVGGTCRVRARLLDDRRTENGEVVGAVELVADDGTVVVSVDGLRCRRIDRRSGPSDTMDDWLYDLRWETPPGGRGPSVIALPTPAALEPVCAAADVTATEQGWDRYYEGVEPLLEEAAAGLVWRALVEAGWDPAQAVVEDELAKTTGTVDSRRRHLQALVDGLVHAGWVVRDGGSVRSSARARPDAEAALDKLAEAFPAFTTDTALVARCGASLAAVLQGRLDAASVLFADDVAGLVARFYRDAPASLFTNTLVADVVAALVVGCDGSRPVEVLEVGGGTGGTTAYVRPVLPPGSAYTFTDLSAHFTQSVTADLGTESVRAVVVDIEKGLAGQGIAPGSFDLVIGANVVHATADIASTIGHLTAALAPGGRLVLVEITRPLLWLDVVFGVTDGWWRFADSPDQRQDHAVLSPEAWTAVLEESGLTDVTLVSDHPPGGPPGQCVIVATWPWAPEAAAEEMPEDERWAVVGTGPVADAIGEMLLRRRALADVAVAGGIVQVAAAGTRPAEAVDALTLFDEQRQACEKWLDIARSPGTSPVRKICVVTTEAQPVGRDHGPLDLARAPLWGLTRVAVKERPEVRWQLVDLPRGPGSADLDRLGDALFAATAEEETAIRDGRRLVRRLRRMEPEPRRALRRAPLPGESWRASVTRPGALETLVLQPVDRHPPGPGQVEVEVSAAGVNFRDVMLAMGLLPALASEGTFGQRALGLDLCGRVATCGPGVELTVGTDVFGIGPGTFASHVTTSARLVTPCPPGLAAADAAGSPCAFVTALYALDRLARLAPGERVLIHSATGGVGMAALQVARRAGAEVLATAGSDDKRELLRSLGVEHVFDSRSLDFATEVMDVTGGAGVDVVLNSLSGEAIARGIETLAPFGRFVELGKRDIYAGSNLGLLAFRRNLSFFAVDLDRLCSERPDLAGELLVEVAALLADGTFEALPSRVFPVGETEEALRLMAQARHVGKITVAMDGSQEIEARPPRCHPDGTYLVTGGTGGFGMATAAWLVDQGAGAVVVVARRPPDEVTARRLGELRATGAEVVAMTADVGVEAQVARLLDDVRRTLPPVRGVVHAAMVLDDAPLDQLDRARLTTGMQAKVLGAWNLHRLTRSDDLDMFVCYSSIAALLGNAGQGGYAAANAFLEALAHHRRALGLEALTVDWGVISEVGYVSRRHDLARHLERQGYRSFTPDQALATLDRLLGHDDPQAMAARIDWGRWATALPDETRSSRLSHFAPAPDSAPAVSGVMQQVLALPEAERLDGVVASVRREVGRVLGVNAARLDLDRPLADLGLDSLIAVELVAVLQLRLGVEVPLVRLLQDTTVTGLAELVLELAEASGTTRRAVPDRAPAEAPAPAAVAATGAAAMPSAPQAGPPSSAASSPPPAPGPIPTNGAGDADADGRKRYQDLDHRRWSPSQRAVKALISTGLRSVLSVEVEGREHLMTPGPYVLATNHLALVDVPLVLTVMPRPVIVMAASDYRSSWLFDWFLSDMGNAIYVDRGTGDLEALERALTVLRSGGVVGLSPEGRRSPSGALERAHAGVAHLAARSGAPVVPMAVWGQEAARATLRRGRRAPVTIRTGAPLAPPRAGAPPAELSAFSDQVMTTIASLLPERYRGVYATGAAHAGVIGNGA
ncbi:MAG: hypothetical protein V7605_2728 [Acidimicrobiaceae bacterium]